MNGTLSVFLSIFWSVRPEIADISLLMNNLLATVAFQDAVVLLMISMQRNRRQNYMFHAVNLKNWKEIERLEKSKTWAINLYLLS